MLNNRGKDGEKEKNWSFVPITSALVKLTPCNFLNKKILLQID